MVLRDAADDLGSERSLVAAARIGDRDAFESLVEPHRRGLHLHCYRMTGSLTDADDMLQESLLKAWRRIDTFESRAPVQVWLYKIATNTCLNELAKRGRPRFLAAQQWSEDAPPLAEIEHLQPYPDRLLDDAADPAAALTRRKASRSPSSPRSSSFLRDSARCCSYATFLPGALARSPTLLSAQLRA